MMAKQGRLATVCMLVFLLTSCVSGLWTGATVIYDRHNLYKKIADYQLTGTIGQALFVDKKFKTAHCTIDVTVFNQIILLAGHVPTESLRAEAFARVQAVSANKRVYNQIQVVETTANAVEDSWITTKIRTKIIADSSIDPNTFKVITTDRIVYLFGEIKPEDAEKVVSIAKNVSGVEKVVKILRYYTYT